MERTVYDETLYQRRWHEMVSKESSDSVSVSDQNRKGKPLPEIPGWNEPYCTIQTLTEEQENQSADAGNPNENNGCGYRWIIIQIVVVIVTVIVAGILGYYIRIATEPGSKETTTVIQYPYCDCDMKECNRVCEDIINGTRLNQPVGFATIGANATIYPDFARDGGIEVYCDCTEGPGLAWTVFQRRMDGSENFYRVWDDYVAGFGSTSGEFWLGLEIISNFTSGGNFELRVDLESFEDETAYAKYSTFSVGNESTKFTLDVDGFSHRGLAGDSLTYHNGQKFSTLDMDNDSSNGTCAVKWKGAWWFNACYQSHLNGLYYADTLLADRSDGIMWMAWKGDHESLKTTEMKFRRKN